MMDFVYLYLGIIALLLLSCRSEKQFKNNNHELMNMQQNNQSGILSLLENKNVDITEVIAIPFDDQNGIPKVYETIPDFSVPFNPNPKVYFTPAPVSIKVSQDGNSGIVLLDQYKYNQHLPQSPLLIWVDFLKKSFTRISVKLEVEEIERKQVIDFLFYEKDSSFLLLEEVRNRLGETNFRLIKFNRSGDLIWNKESIISAKNKAKELIESPKKLLHNDKGLVLLQSESMNANHFYKVNLNSGELTKWGTLNIYGIESIALDNEIIYFIDFDDRANSHNLKEFSPPNSIFKLKEFSRQAFAYMKTPVFLDKKEHAYGTAGKSLGCMNKSGNLEWKMDIENILIDDENLIVFTLDSSNNNANVFHFNKGGESKRALPISFPDTISNKKINRWRLVDLTSEEKYVFQTESSDKSLLIAVEFDLEGKLVKVNSKEDYDKTKYPWLQLPKTWGISKSGSIVIPVFMSEKFHLVKITLNA